jgi:hypothetical protein
MTPTGELITGSSGSKFLALRPDSDVREALMANLGPGESLLASDLPRVSTPAGGGKVWSWTDSGNNEQTAKSIDGILVYYGVRGTLWGSEEPQGKASPVLVSYDLMTAVRVNDDIGDLDAEALEACRIGDRQYDWTRLPYNQYGTSKSGRGKRCKESRLLAVLRADEAWPLLVTAGPGSLKTVTPFVKRLPVPHFRAVVSLTLEKVENAGGQPYSQIVPRTLGTISKEEGEIVKRLYTEPLSRIATQIDVSQDVA